MRIKTKLNNVWGLATSGELKKIEFFVDGVLYSFKAEEDNLFIYAVLDENTQNLNQIADKIIRTNFYFISDPDICVGLDMNKSRFVAIRVIKSFSQLKLDQFVAEFEKHANFVDAYVYILRVKNNEHTSTMQSSSDRLRSHRA